VILLCLLTFVVDSSATRSEPELLQMQYSHRSPSSPSVNKNCKVDCSSAKRRLYCGTDGKQYISKCEIRRKRRCEGVNVDVLNRGECPGRRGCPQHDRAAFNTNLISHFSTEFSRIPKPSKRPQKELPIQSESDAILDTKEKRVIEWKFTELDTDKDGYLTRKEIRDFKKLAKKVVRPRRCAKLLDKYCDISRDRRIDRNEWSVCLGVDINSKSISP